MVVGILPALAGKTLAAVRPLDGSVRGAALRAAAARLPAAAAGEDVEADAGEARAARLGVRPLELVEVVVEDGDGEGWAEVVLPARHRHRAQAGAGAVLAVSAPQMLRKLSESDAGDLQLVPSLMVPERHCLVFLRVRPEHEVGVSPGRLGRLHLEGVVVVALRNEMFGVEY